MELNKEDILELECCLEDEEGLLSGLLELQMEDNDLFHRECNML